MVYSALKQKSVLPVRLIICILEKNTNPAVIVYIAGDILYLNILIFNIE